MDPKVREYLLAKRYAEAGDDEEIKKAERQEKLKGVGAGLMSAAEQWALAEHNQTPTGKTWDKVRADAKANVDKAKAARDLKQKDVLKQNELEQLEETQGFAGEQRTRQRSDWAEGDSKLAQEKDVNSDVSKSYQNLASKMLPGRDFSTMSAAQLKGLMPSLEKSYGIDQNRLARQDAIAAKKEAAAAAATLKREEKERLGSEGQREIDTKYAKPYHEFTGKGRVNAQNTIKQLKELKNELENEDAKIFPSGGGRTTAFIPDWARTSTSIRLKSEIPAKANLVLKDLFGGAMSNDERKSESETYYNDLLGPRENAQILQKKIDILEDQLKSETAKASYYQNSGTLRGFDGLNSTPNDKPRGMSGKDLPD